MSTFIKKPIFKVLVATFLILLSLFLYSKLVIETGAIQTFERSNKIVAKSNIKMVSHICDIFNDAYKSSLYTVDEAKGRAIKELRNLNKDSENLNEIWVIDFHNRDVLVDKSNSELNQTTIFSAYNKDVIYSKLRSAEYVYTPLLTNKDDSGQYIYRTTFTLYEEWNWIIGINMNNNEIKNIIRGVKNRVLSNFFATIIILLIVLFFILLITHKEEQKLKHANETLKGSKNELDITLQKRSSELEETKKHFIEAERMAVLGTLVGSFTHDISTPVGGSKIIVSDLIYRNEHILNIVGKNSLKKNDLDSFLTQSKLGLDILEKNIEITIKQLDSFKSMAIGQQSDNIEFVNLKEFLNVILIGAAPLLRGGSFKCRCECPDSIILYTKPGALSQILLNLIVNSIKHGFKGKEEGEISLEVNQEDDKIAIFYRDNGHGISSELETKIWEPFFTTAKDNGGTGLGLYNVKNLTETSLGGEITFLEDDGFSIKIVLPSMD